MSKKVAIACDHAGVEYKNAVAEHLRERGFEVTDYGCDGSCSVAYPEYAHHVCRAIQDKSADWGILICGTGIGMSIAANKHRGIRAALCDNEISAEMTRRHNDANVLCMGARVISKELAVKLSDIFADSEFEGGRHVKRVEMLNALDDRDGSVK